MLAATVIAGSMPTAAAAATAAPPSPSVLTTSTNALLRPADVVGVLATQVSASDSYRVGYMSPPGGQDPLPVCDYGTGAAQVAIPSSQAIGYSAVDGPLWQDVYVYPSAAAAQRAWTGLNARIPAKCSGIAGDARDRSRLSSTHVDGIGGGPQGWAVLDISRYSAKYSIVRLLGDSIVMVSYSAQRSTLPRGITPAVTALAAALADRWIGRESAPITQDATLTWAQQVMLATADIPNALPILTPAKGGWSQFVSYTPDRDLFACFGVLERLGAQSSYSVELGGTGDVDPGTGSIGQRVFDYATADAARTDWRRLAKAMAACSTNRSIATPRRGDFTRRQHGVSALQYDGVPGLWSRELQWIDGSESTCSDATGPVACTSLSTKGYAVWLLVGNTIQVVGYQRGAAGLRELALDQVAVNVLAEHLATRWVQGRPQD